MREKLARIRNKLRPAVAVAATEAPLIATTTVAAGAVAIDRPGFALAALLTGATTDFLLRRGPNRNARAEGYRQGQRDGFTERARRAAIVQAGIRGADEDTLPETFRLPPDGTPCYASLDGSVTFDKPHQVIYAIGPNAEVEGQVSRILQLDELGLASLMDIEYARMVRAALDLDSKRTEKIFAGKDGLLEKMNTFIEEAERQYRESHPQPSVE